MATPILTVYRTRSLRRSQRWAWRLTATNGRVVAVSGEGYAHEAEAERMGRAVCGGAYVDHRLVIAP